MNTKPLHAGMSRFIEECGFVFVQLQTVPSSLCCMCYMLNKNAWSFTY